MLEHGFCSAGPQFLQVTVLTTREMVAIDSMAGQTDRLHGWQWLHVLHDNSGS